MMRGRGRRRAPGRSNTRFAVTLIIVLCAGGSLSLFMVNALAATPHGRGHSAARATAGGVTSTEAGATGTATDSTGTSTSGASTGSTGTGTTGSTATGTTGLTGTSWTTTSPTGTGTVTAVSATGTPLARGLKVVATPASCPYGDRHVVADTGHTQARHDMLAPLSGERAILLCRYRGLALAFKHHRRSAYRLVASHRVTDISEVRRLVVALNRVRAVKRGAAYPCPYDGYADIVAYLEMRRGQAYRYAIDTGGCQQITSGSVWRYGLNAPFIGRLERLTAVHARTTGSGNA